MTKLIICDWTESKCSFRQLAVSFAYRNNKLASEIETLLGSIIDRIYLAAVRYHAAGGGAAPLSLRRRVVSTTCLRPSLDVIHSCE